MEDYGITGTRVELETHVDVPRERLWDLITSVPRIGEWSPECEHGAWVSGAEPELKPGTRFEGRNRREGRVWTVTCMVTEAVRPSTFAWVVLDPADDPERPGSTWRYDLEPGDTPDRTLVRHSFVHGPGRTGLRDMIEDNAEIAELILEVRKGELLKHMQETLDAMARP
ncbi:SRPBCC family protein [Sphaerisporangium sp. TRM90804]|uniref:SRPBCC family protein n=1 Tax=Sphaerisporangium sp. TRM90804 TaxID=3031113 RepID=UPI00244D4996|nr:SRPBCC family protein [Sphaerisporangium sp. TRM90804]MDH2425843.1 SRPBCC family protein [Sphaerisporangium sp. TRM90804]